MFAHTSSSTKRQRGHPNRSRHSERAECPEDTCIPNTVGCPGPRGVQGSPGPPGYPGADGDQGAPGADGSNGTNGTNGVPGLNGTSGANGTNGANGANGVPGIDGQPTIMYGLNLSGGFFDNNPVAGFVPVPITGIQYNGWWVIDIGASNVIQHVVIPIDGVYQFHAHSVVQFIMGSQATFTTRLEVDTGGGFVAILGTTREMSPLASANFAILAQSATTVIRSFNANDLVRFVYTRNFTELESSITGSYSGVSAYMIRST